MMMSSPVTVASIHRHCKASLTAIYLDLNRSFLLYAFYVIILHQVID